MRASRTTLLATLIAAGLLGACKSSGGDAADLLLQIQQRGTIVVSTDPNYAPQAQLRSDGARTPDTRCSGDQLTTGELEGFDIDTAVEIARRLEVEACFVAPDWDLITAGNWGGRWDVSVGSMAITTARQRVLHFSVPYYYTPAQFAAATSAGITGVEQLANRPICVGTATTYESWLEGDMAGLGLPESSIHAQPPAGVTVVPLPADQECPQAIAAGRTDFPAYLTSRTVVQQNIAAGIPVTMVGDPVFTEQLAVAIDKQSPIPTDQLRARIDEIVTAMHADGTLSRSSQRWFGMDLSQQPGAAPAP